MVSGTAPLLAFEGLRVEYLSTSAAVPAVVAVDGASFRLRKGDCIRLTGSNGSGKSTLLKVIAGLVDVAAGRVWYEGIPVPASEVPRRCTVAMVRQDQDDAVVPMLRVGDHLAFRISRAVHRATSFAHARGLALEYLKGLPKLAPLIARIDDDASGLSGGWKQLLQIAACVSCKPDILLLDEPTSHLAPEFAELAEEILCDGIERNVVLYVSHQPPGPLVSRRITAEFHMEGGRLHGAAA